MHVYIILNIKSYFHFPLLVECVKHYVMGPHGHKLHVLPPVGHQADHSNTILALTLYHQSTIQVAWNYLVILAVKSKKKIFQEPFEYSL